ncbi:MAG: hypothetical protein U0132_20120 [Gemmatimonadaceae bacterium]
MKGSFLQTPAARFAIAAGAVGVATAAFVAPIFRNADGTLAPGSAFPLTLAIGMLVVALTATTVWQRPGLWTGLLIAGQGAALQLIDAPNKVVYQHYRFVTGAGPVLPIVPLLVIGVQVGWVLWGLRGTRGGVIAWWRSSLSPVARALAVLGFVLTSATLSRMPALYVGELLVAALVQGVAVLNVICIARAMPASAAHAFDAVLAPHGTAERSYRAVEPFSLVLAAWVLAVSALLAVVVYERHPHVPDEVVYLLQARYLAKGHLWLPLPPVPEAFNLDLMYSDATRWFSPVNPGWPFVLAVGAWLGVPWLVNPVLGAICVLLANGVLAELYPVRTRRVALLLLATSPWFLFMSMNFMTHQLVMVSALGAALAVARARRVAAGRPLRMLVGGLCIGVVSLVRPLEGLAVALLLGVWSLPITGRRFRFSPSAWLVVGSVLSGLLARPYNALMTGDPSYFPIMAYIDKYYAKGANDLGFGPNRGLGWSGLDPIPGHGPLDVIVNADLNVFSINTDLLGWAIGSLGVVVFLLAGRRLRRADWWMVAVIAMVAGIHSFYWFSGGPDFGARYWYLVLVPAVVLAVRGVEEIAATAAPYAAQASGRALMATLGLMLAALVSFVPWRSIAKYHHFRNMRADVRTLASEHHFGRSLILVRGNRHPDYASAAIYNPIDLRADAPIFVWDASPEVRRQALAAYPDRPVWVVEGTTVTGGAFRVSAGPLTTAQALALP